jgi:hypothetical protein
MSLWNLPLESLTFEQLDGFLQLKLPEGARLDYKLEVPNDLAKIIAAFANTLGGLIVLGVAEDGPTTEPLWPPDPATGRGMPINRGLRERVVQIARDAIYPPVSVRLSPLIENTHLPGNGLLAVRVDESRDAPHAVERRREVYVYERVDTTTPPYRLADIDRIAAMLDRRRKIEDDRDRLLQAELTRATELLTKNYPLRWVALTPYFPWRTLYPRSLCYQAHAQLFPSPDRFRGSTQQMADGSYMRGILPNGGLCNRCSRLSDNGLAFEIEVAEEIDLHGRTGGIVPNLAPQLSLDPMIRMMKRVITASMQLCERGKTDEPGLYMLSVGLINVRQARLYLEAGRHASRSPFLDERFRADRIGDFSSLKSAPWTAAAEALEEVVYSFDMPTIAGFRGFIQQYWTAL